MVRTEIASKFSAPFAVWYCGFDPNHEDTDPAEIARMFSAWDAGRQDGAQFVTSRTVVDLDS